MRTVMWAPSAFVVRRRYGFRGCCAFRPAPRPLMLAGALIGLLVGMFVSRLPNEVVGFALSGALFGLAFEQLKGGNIVRLSQPSNASQPGNATQPANASQASKSSQPAKASSVSSRKMKTHEREHHMTMVLLTSGIGGMVLGFGVYSFTHFAPAIFCGVVLSVLFTLWVTRERK